MNVALTSLTFPVGRFEGRTAEDIIADIARVSNPQNQGKDATSLIRYLIKHKHWSPFEHATITFEIQTSRAIGTQLLRHWSFRFQEFSQRYSQVTSIEPIELRRQSESNRQSSEEVFDPILPAYGDGDLLASEIIAGHLEATKKLYEELIRAGVAKECARMVLPLATSTTIYMTGNLRSWIFMLASRLDEGHAQKEVVEISKLIYDELAKEFPSVMLALREECAL